MDKKIEERLTALRILSQDYITDWCQVLTLSDNNTSDETSDDTEMRTYVSDWQMF